MVAIGWEKTAPDIHVHEVPGTHFGLLLGENLRVSSEVIRDCLEKADARSSAGDAAQSGAGNS